MPLTRAKLAIPFVGADLFPMGTDTYTDVDFPDGFPGIPSIHPPGGLIAGPQSWRGKDVPSQSSEFAHPDVPWLLKISADW